jgi:phosphoribosyl-AMP cyclohydrolase
MGWIDELVFDAQGLIPAIIQDHGDGQILMMAWMNRESVADTLKTGKTHFWSRSRKKYWMKGESSGNVQNVKNVYFDCDRDVLLIKVEQVGGAACHTGHRTCFFSRIEQEKVVIEGKPLFDPDKVYKKH